MTAETKAEFLSRIRRELEKLHGEIFPRDENGKYSCDANALLLWDVLDCVTEGEGADARTIAGELGTYVSNVRWALSELKSRGLIRRVEVWEKTTPTKKEDGRDDA